MFLLSVSGLVTARVLLCSPYSLCSCNNFNNRTDFVFISWSHSMIYTKFKKVTLLFVLYIWLITDKRRAIWPKMSYRMVYVKKQAAWYIFFNLDSCSIVLRQILVTWRYWSNTAQTNKRYDTYTPLMEKNYSSSYCYVSWITKQ